MGFEKARLRSSRLARGSFVPAKPSDTNMQRIWYTCTLPVQYKCHLCVANINSTGGLEVASNCTALYVEFSNAPCSYHVSR